MQIFLTFQSHANVLVARYAVYVYYMYVQLDVACLRVVASARPRPKANGDPLH